MVTQQQEDEIIDKMLSVSSNNYSPQNLLIRIIHALPSDYSGSKTVEGNRIFDRMQDDFHLIKMVSKDTFYLTEVARQVLESGGWLAVQAAIKADEDAEFEDRQLDKHIKKLVHEELITNISNLREEMAVRQISMFQVRYWWLILLLSMAGSAFLGAWFQRLFS